MARPKKQTRQTSFVTIRQKERAKGRKSLYLDIYKNGKRSYEFLDLYLVPEIDDAAKTLNENTMNKAMAIRNQRELMVINGDEFQPKAKEKILLADFMESFRKEKKKNGQSGAHAETVRIAALHLADYAGKDVTLADIDKDFCKGFIHHLLSTNKKGCKKHPTKMLPSSARNYYIAFVSALNEAVKMNLISFNPAHRLSKEEMNPIKRTKSNRSFLAIEEVKKLIETKCRDERTKRAFLFSCFTGLRISDILNLTWDNISERNGSTYLNIVIKKTKQPFTIKLNSEALRWMPERTSGKVFELPNMGNVNVQIKDWVKLAGINKYVCFHTARHTFATMSLTLGADLYTVSKLLAHQNISVTQIYAEIIDEKKDKAVDLMNGIFDK